MWVNTTTSQQQNRLPRNPQRPTSWPRLGLAGWAFFVGISRPTGQSNLFCLLRYCNTLWGPLYLLAVKPPHTTTRKGELTMALTKKERLLKAQANKVAAAEYQLDKLVAEIYADIEKLERRIAMAPVHRARYELNMFVETFNWCWAPKRYDRNDSQGAKVYRDGMRALAAIGKVPNGLRHNLRITKRMVNELAKVTRCTQQELDAMDCR